MKAEASAARVIALFQVGGWLSRAWRAGLP